MEDSEVKVSEFENVQLYSPTINYDGSGPYACLQGDTRTCGQAVLRDDYVALLTAHKAALEALRLHKGAMSEDTRRQAIEDVAGYLGHRSCLADIENWCRPNSAPNSVAYAVAQREQNIRLESEARWVRDHVHEFGKSSNWPVIFSRLSRVLDTQVQAALEKEE